MAITYPLSIPTNLGPSNISLSAENVGAISQSPFTFNQQVIKHSGERWLSTVTLPPMKRSDAEPWISFLLSLKGTYGTFLMGDPNAVQPQGSVVQRNLFQYSEDFSNAYWNKNASTVASTAQTNPVSGLGTGVYQLIEDSATAQHSVVRAFSYTAGTTYTFTTYVKKGSASRNVLVLLASSAFTVQQSFIVDLDTGAVSNISGTPIIVVESVNGFYKLTVTATATVSTTASTGTFLVNGGVTNYLGNGTSFIYISDFQIEASSTATAYQKVIGSFGPTPLVNGGSQVGETLLIKNLNQLVVGVLKAGDYIQLGTGSGTRLHKVLSDVTSDASGNASVDIWPSLRESPANNATITVVGTKARFRLGQNLQSWEINNISSYGMTFDCIEAL